MCRNCIRIGTRTIFLPLPLSESLTYELLYQPIIIDKTDLDLWAFWNRLDKDLLTSVMKKAGIPKDEIDTLGSI